MKIKNKSENKTVCNILLVCLPLLVLGSLNAAATYTFDPSGSGANNWSNTNKWNTAPGSGGSESIIQLPKVEANTTLTIDQNATIGQLLIGNGGSGSSPWSLNGSGVLTLDNGASLAAITNNSGGNTTITANLQATNGVSLGGQYAIIINNGNSRLNGGITISSSSSFYIINASTLGDSTITFTGNGTGRNIRLGAGSATIFTTNNNFVTEGGAAERIAAIVSNSTTGLELKGDITGDGGIRFTTEGATRNDKTWLSGDNSYEGDTYIRTNIVFNSINNFGKGSIIFESNKKTLTFNSGNTADITKSRDGSTSRDVTLNIDTTFDVGSNNVTFENTVKGTSALIKSGAGSLTLNGTNIFQGAVLSEGTLILGNVSALGGSTSSLSINGNNTTLSINKDIEVFIDNLTLENNTKFVFSLSEQANGTGLRIGGDQTGEKLIDIEIADDSTIVLGTTYKLLSIDGTFDVNENSFALTIPSQDYGDLYWDNDHGILYLNTIPEPSTGLFLLISSVLFFFGRRTKIG